MSSLFPIASLLMLWSAGLLAEKTGCLRVSQLGADDHFIDLCDSSREVDLLWQGNMGEVCSPDESRYWREPEHYFLLYSENDFLGYYLLVKHGECREILPWQRIKSVLHCTFKRVWGHDEGTWHCDTRSIKNRPGSQRTLKHIPQSFQEAVRGDDAKFLKKGNKKEEFH